MNPMSQIMKSVSAIMPSDTAPANSVASFVNAEFEKIFPDVDDIALVKTLSVTLANENPQEVLNKLCAFSNDISDFVNEITMEQSMDDTAQSGEDEEARSDD